MHSITHFLVAATLLLAIGAPVQYALLFALIFGVLIDVDILVGWKMGNPRHHGRTWVQEPFGLLLLGVPVGIVVERFLPQGFALVTIPYASHVLLDYLSKHEVSPLAPFSKKSIEVGLFRPLREKEGHGPSELSVLVLAAVVLTAILL